MIPIVDISRHQGNADMAVLHASGVEGLIVRVGNGNTIDTTAAGFYRQARFAGYPPNLIGFYTFINPKRGTAVQAADANLDYIAQFVEGAAPAFFMLDIENYANESPNVGATTLRGAPFAAYLRAYMAVIRGRFPTTKIVGYAGRSYYDGWVGDAALAAELDWIVPRYPVYPSGLLLAQATAGNPGPLNAWIATSSKPPSPAGWAAWATMKQPAGPVPPTGAVWAGWQFSAGFNRQAATYGFTGGSLDLDLNFIDPEAWARWTQPTPPPPPPTAGDDMPLAHNLETRPDGTPPRGNIFVLMPEGALRHIGGEEWLILGQQFGVGLTNAQIDNLGFYDGVRANNLDEIPAPVVPPIVLPPFTITGTAVPQ